MENASKALIMAGGILVGILVMSLFIYLIVSFGATSDKLHEQNAQTQINQFNTQFTIYTDKENITIYDIISVANLARENNEQTNEYFITIKLREKNKSEVSLTDTSINLISKIKENVDAAGGEGEYSESSIKNLQRYKVLSIQYDDTGRIKTIIFKYV